jgi:hypothetical protein
VPLGAIRIDDNNDSRTKEKDLTTGKIDGKKIKGWQNEITERTT